MVSIVENRGYMSTAALVFNKIGFDNSGGVAAVNVITLDSRDRPNSYSVVIIRA